MVVLVIDDDAAIREAVADILDIAEIETIPAETGREGIALFEKQYANIGAVILDIQLPGMDGYEVFTQLRNINPNIKIILSSGYGRLDTAKPFEAESGIEFLDKPYSIESLITMVQNAFAQA